MRSRFRVVSATEPIGESETPGNGSHSTLGELLYADRTPKFPLHAIAAATMGTQVQPDSNDPLVGSVPVSLLRGGHDDSDAAPSE